MKIGILTEIINYHSGARAPLEIAKHLAKRGHEISVYAYDFGQDRNALQDLKNYGVTVSMFNKQHFAFMEKYVAALSLFITLRRNPPEAILFSGTLPFFLAGKLTGIPIIWMYMGTQFNALLENTIPNQGISFIVKTLNAVVNVYIYLVGFIIYRLSAGLVAISKYAAHEGKHLYKRNANMVIYLGTAFFQKHNTKTLRKKDYISLLSVSRITPYKGFHLIIEAIKKIKTDRKIIFTISGSQPKQKYLAYLKKIGGKNIRIIIDPPDQELARLYQNSDIYVTADRYLYFGLPIIEAAQFGKPTVSLNFAASKEIIAHNKTGFIANNINEFSNYLQKLIENDSLRNALGRNALQRSKEYTWEICAKNWEIALKRFAM